MTTIQIDPPTFHRGQVKLWKNRGRLNAVCCGRRWGKTKFLVTLAAQYALQGRKVGIFAPEHRQLFEPYEELAAMLKPITRNSSKNDGIIRTINGGHLDFWYLTDNELAGRGREYHLVLGDEMAFSKNAQMMDIWKKSIKPTMLTTKGHAWMFSTPNGVDQENYFYQICRDPDLEFKFHHAPTASNPYVPQDELAKEEKSNHPLVFQQEFLAEFISWSNSTFFKLEYFLVDEQPVEYPVKCDAVFAVMDCAVKSGSDNDATAVMYFAVNRHFGTKLVILDYDAFAIEAASLEYLAPLILERCEELAKATSARNGSLGVFVEDAAGGSVLLQWAKARAWPFHPIDSKLMAKGKDERAMLAGGPAHAGECKVSRYAFDKTIVWKGRTMNHFLQQVTTFRIGDKEAYKRADDLLDTFTYGVALTLTDHRAL